MKSLKVLTCLGLLMALATSAAADSRVQALQGYTVADAAYPHMLPSLSHSWLAKSGADTFCMISHVWSPTHDDEEVNYTIGQEIHIWDAAYSCQPWPIFLGPQPGNTYNGDFQIDNGLPNWDDWNCVDYTQRDTEIWHCSTYNSVSGNSWYCGDENVPSCGGSDTVGGYGNNYDEWLSYYATVENPDLQTIITLAYDINYDTEPGYDYTYVRYKTANGWETAAEHDGGPTSLTNQIVYMAFESADYVNVNQCYFQFQGMSDGGWSDVDCLWPTIGMCQVDNMTVVGTNGVATTTEDCDGSVVGWIVESPPAVGAFCFIWPHLREIDDCCVNETPQVGFIDNGVVVPGTGGSHGITWTYGNEGWIVNTEGGLAGSDYHLHNEVWSPIVHWPDADVGITEQYDGAFIEFSVYRHFDLGPVWGGMFYVWHVRSTASTDPCDIQTEAWRDRNFVYYGRPDCIRHANLVSDLLQPGRKFVQMALGIYELGWVWGWDGQDASPAPYFDDVRFCATVAGGSFITVLNIDLAQDSFPESGELNCSEPCGMNVRFDMARDIAPGLTNLPGDSIVFTVVARTGTTLPAEDTPGFPELCYKLDPNPLFDACRDSGLPNHGCVYGDSARTNGQGHRARDKFAFDLPDTGFFFPGDQIHYYVRATDTGGGTATLPGDTSGFSHFPGDPCYIMLDYPSPFIVRALPGINDLISCTNPEILWWNDYGSAGLEPEWMHTWKSNGFVEGEDFDIYYTHGPSSGAGNGLGGRATAGQLDGYRMIAYSSGDLDVYTITDANEDDSGDDIGVLDAWMESGDKCMFLTGNDLVDDLNNQGGDALAFENKYIQVDFVDTRHDNLVHQWNPAVEPVPYPPANSAFFCATRWMVDSYCNRRLRHIDMVIPDGDDNPGEVAEFLTPPGADPPCDSNDTYEYAAAVYNFEPDGIENGKVLYLPYDLGWIRDDTGCGGNEGTCQIPHPWATVRAQILKDAMQLEGIAPGDSAVGVPSSLATSFKQYPNPFNPRTRIEYNLARAGHLDLSIYNVRGELVRVLLDEVTPAGPGFVIWDGNDAEGATVSSGVYFLSTRAPDKKSVSKMVLIR